MSNSATNISNLYITNYFDDHFIFNNNYERKNLESFENDRSKNDLFQNYKKHNINIMNLINRRNNNNY